MRISTTLSRHIAQQFLLWFALIFTGMSVLTLMLDAIELMRRGAARQEVTLGLIAQMSFLKMPLMAQELVPFAILFSGMLVFSRLTRNHELVVARAAGVSVWQFLLPAIVTALAIGSLQILAFNPFAAATTARFENLEARYYQGRSSLISISSSGLWLRQGDDKEQSVIHASRVMPDSMNLQDIIIFTFDQDDHFSGRVDGAEANLKNGFWEVSRAWVTAPDTPPRFMSTYKIPTTFTPARIQESFASPETMSFWSLPDFIGTMEAAGFSALKHRLHWQSLLATPFLICAMVLIAATFSLRLVRHGGTTLVIGGGILAGFLFYFISDVVYALGLSASLPVALAAWSPVLITSLLGMAMLFHLEDG